MHGHFCIAAASKRGCRGRESIPRPRASQRNAVATKQQRRVVIYTARPVGFYPASVYTFLKGQRSFSCSFQVCILRYVRQVSPATNSPLNAFSNKIALIHIAPLYETSGSRDAPADYQYVHCFTPVGRNETVLH